MPSSLSCISILCLANCLEAQTMPMLDLRGDWIVSTGSANQQLNFATLAKDPVGALPNQFTLCISYFVANKVGRLSQWTLLGEDGRDWLFVYTDIMNVKKDTEDMGYTLWLRTATSDFYLPPFFGRPFVFNRWFHLCLGFDLASGLISPVAQGVVLKERIIPEVTANRPSSLAGRLLLGTYRRDGQVREVQALLANAQVFGRKLTVPEMINISSSRECGTPGDYLAWDQVANTSF